MTVVGTCQEALGGIRMRDSPVPEDGDTVFTPSSETTTKPIQTAAVALFGLLLVLLAALLASVAYLELRLNPPSSAANQGNWWPMRIMFGACVGALAVSVGATSLAVKERHRLRHTE